METKQEIINFRKSLADFFALRSEELSNMSGYDFKNEGNGDGVIGALKIARRIAFTQSQEKAHTMKMLQELSKLMGWFLKTNKTNWKFKINYQFENFGRVEWASFKGELTNGYIDETYYFLRYLESEMNVSFSIFHSMEIKAKEKKEREEREAREAMPATERQVSLIKKIQGIDFLGTKKEASHLIDKIAKNGWKKL